MVWLGKNAVEFFELLFAAAAVRAGVAPLNFRLTPEELIELTDDAEAGLVVLGPDFAGLREKLARDGRRVLVVGEDYEGWVDGLTDRTEPDPDAEDEDTVLQLYTSGTTGKAKGVLLSHRNFGALLSVGGHWGFDDESVGMVAMPLFHIGGSGFGLVCLSFGARVVLVADIVPDQLLDTMEREGITNAFLVPAVLQFLCQVPGAAERDWSKLRAVAYGASPITGPVLNKVLATFRAPLFQVYGSTETTGAITQLDPDDHDPDGPRAHLMRSAGRAYPWVELQDRRSGVGRAAAGERGRRGLDPLLAGDLGLLAAARGDREVDHLRRLVPHRRRRLPRRRGLPVPDRPHQGHDRHGRGERLSDRGRERRRAAPGGRGRRRHRGPGRASGARR